MRGASHYRSDVVLTTRGDVIDLACQLIDIPSVSGDEQLIADAVEGALHTAPHLEVTRIGHTVIARSRRTGSRRVVIGGHFDTVPPHGNTGARVDNGLLYGLGAVDMKANIAIALRVAIDITEPGYDITYVFYECEEVAAQRNGLLRVLRERPELLACDLAILMEPSNGGVEAGCQGTMRVDVTVSGERAHSARSWTGTNAIHGARRLLSALDSFEPEQPIVDGLTYREGLNAVGIRGGVAGNVIPDSCVVTLNYRFAPHRSEEDARDYVRSFVVDAGHVDTVLEVVDSAPGARPGLGDPLIAGFVAAMGVSPQPKYGWTDVARFSALGIPALNFGAGDPALAHHADECVPVSQVREVEHRLRTWLATTPA
jgi:succinyl-diaminopimelate desuccinylase